MTQTTNTTAAIIIIGAEVLSGKVNDENGPFLLRALRERGIDVKEIRIIDDDRKTIATALRELANQVTFVFTTGGIGPTHDDITLESVAEAFNCALVRNQELATRFKERVRDPKRQIAALRMADVPEGSTVTMVEFAPVIQKENVTILPGVPILMRNCFAAIASEFHGAPFFSDAIFLKTSESAIATHLSQVQANHPQVAIGSYPQFGDSPYRVKVTVDSRDNEAVKAAMEAISIGLQASWLVRPEE